MRRGLAPVLLAALALFFAAPAHVACADGDPASDVLLGENVFYPYAPAVSGALQSRLDALVAAAARAHFPIKVALIDTPPDLGTVPVLFGKPQQYADFLEQEISFGAPRPLLVVMPDGYGVRDLSAAATAATASLPKPAGNQSNDLARAAIGAVETLAARAGHPIPNAVATSAGGGAHHSGTILIIACALAAIAIAGGVLAVRARSSRPRPRDG